MDPYQPYQSLKWYYNHNESWIKVKSEIQIEYDPNDGARRITASASAFKPGEGATITLTVHEDGTADPNPDTLVVYIEAEEVGSNLSQEEIEGIIDGFEPSFITSQCSYKTYDKENKNEIGNNTELEYL